MRFSLKNLSLYCLILCLALPSARPSFSAPAELESPLSLAAQRGDVEELGRLLDGGADVNDRSAPRGPLLTALIHKQEAAALFLIERGADIHDQRWGDRFPLIMAVNKHLNPVVRKLLASDVNIHQRRRTGWNSLMEAALVSNLEAMRLLIAAGAPVDRTDHLNATALYYTASSRNHLETLKILLAQGARVEYRTANPEFYELVLRKRTNYDMDKLTGCQKYGDADQTPLLAFVRKNSPEAVALLLRAGANVHTVTLEGHDALSFARSVERELAAEQKTTELAKTRRIIALLKAAGALERPFAQKPRYLCRG